MEEAQKLHSEVISLRSGVRVKGVRARLRVRNQIHEGPSSRHGGPGHQFGSSSDCAESSDSWHKRARRGWTEQVAVTGVNGGASPFL